MNSRDVGQQSVQEAEADAPRLIDRSMDSEEGDDWPVNGPPLHAPVQFPAGTD